MPCSRCPSWVTSQFKCLKCGNVFIYRHRDKNAPTSHLERRKYKCNACNGSEFEFIGKI